MFFAREPQTAVLSGNKLSFAKSMFNYTTTFQQHSDIFYPYGHTEVLKSPRHAVFTGIVGHFYQIFFNNCATSLRGGGQKLLLQTHHQRVLLSVEKVG